MENLTWPQFFNSFGKKRTEQCEKCEFFSKELACSQGGTPKKYHVGIVEPADLHADFECTAFLAKQLGTVTLEEQKAYGKHPGKESQVGANSEQKDSKGVQ